MLKKLFVILFCLSSIYIFSRTNKEDGLKISFVGQIVSYGSEPHTTIMIKDMDGNLYYPIEDLQQTVKELPRVTYKWEGYMLEPLQGLPGLIPKHKGTFKEIKWEVFDN